MKFRLISFLIIYVFTSLFIFGRKWNVDILGDDFKYTTIEQPDDYSGKVISTIIKKEPIIKGDRAILYIHGYNDYFFQKEMADTFTAHGYNFYAIDLRKYGRSILKDQTKFEARSLDEYFQDIDSSLYILKEEGISNVILMGHSTGGLISSYYLSSKKDQEGIIKALILNSPFLEFNLNSFQKEYLVPLVSSFSGVFPNISIPQNSNDAYAQSLLRNYHGEWDYNTSWKLPLSPDVTSGWIGAIYKAQQKLHNNANINIPILLMRSDRSIYGEAWTPDFNRGDAVLNVDDISKYGRKLGSNVKEVVVKEGLHDLFLSHKPVRDALYNYIFNRLKTN